MRRKTSYVVWIVKIGPPVRPGPVTKRPKRQRMKPIHQFSGKRGTAQTTHVVRSHPNTVWHGGCSSSSSCQFQLSSFINIGRTVTESCEGRNRADFGWFYYLDQWLMQQPHGRDARYVAMRCRTVLCGTTRYHIRCEWTFDVSSSLKEVLMQNSKKERKLNSILWYSNVERKANICHLPQNS